MDDNSSSDDEIQESIHSPQQGGKKLKLNDGSSQDSLKDAATSNTGEKDENVDSGVSADKSESTSSDDRATATAEGPSNIIIHAGPSGSNVHAILLNIRRPKRGRNYRKRRTPDRDSDTNDSSADSDDLSVDENVQRGDTSSEGDSDGSQRIIATFSAGTPSGSSNSSSSDSNNSYGTDDMGPIQSGDTDSDDDELWPRNNMDNDDENDENETKPKLPNVLTKERPKHKYAILREVINRELGLTFPRGKAPKSDLIFEQNYYGSLHAVYRLKKLHTLYKHRGCVNSINFHPEGQLLASGSDDMNVVIWDWSRRTALQTLRTGHKSNVFQSKFLYLNAQSQLNIVTCARDGQVRLLQCPPSGGGGVSRRRMACHARPAHKLHVWPSEPHAVVSAGEDGLVMRCDVRADHASRLFQVKERGSSVPLYSVHGHPLQPTHLCVAGRDRFVRVYDTRSAARPLALYCPTALLDRSDARKSKMNLMHLTCAVYNHDGSEILGSYNDEDIYLFDTKQDIYDKDSHNESKSGYTHHYSGHRNSATFKGVSFFGPKSQYVVSGSDCSYIYVWDKETEAIVQWLYGDSQGVVNCIETHPRCPVMATSGLDADVKIWVPKSDSDPDFQGLERVVRDNSFSHLRSPLFNDFLPSLYSAWRGENRLFSDGNSSPSYAGNIEFDGNVCTTF